MKHNLVSTTTLADLAKELGLGDFIRVGRGEEKTGGRKKQALLTNTLEAVIAAVFFDGGYVAARALIMRIFAEELKNTSPEMSADYKSLLQERLQGEKLSAPTYTVVQTDGMPHARTFLVEASWKDGTARGKGNSIKAAEMMAAREALKKLGEERSDRERAA
jgi:ribonuclease-3